MKKGAKLALVLLLVAAGGALAYAGALPEGYKGVAQVVADPLAYEGRAIELKGSVLEGSLLREGERVSFLLAEGDARLRVEWDPAIPLPEHEAGGTLEGKNVVVTGTVVLDETGLHLVATRMQVGCASKYRPE